MSKEEKAKEPETQLDQTMTTAAVVLATNGIKNNKGKSLRRFLLDPSTKQWKGSNSQPEQYVR